MSRPETAYHRDIFELWYASRRNIATTCENLTQNRATIYRWAELFGWQERADRRDMEAARLAEADAIERRRLMIESQRQSGQLLRSLGTKYLISKRNNGGNAVDNVRDAVTAIEKGFALERQAEGMPDWVGKIISASDTELADEYTDFLRRAADAERMAQSGGYARGTSATRLDSAETDE